MVYIIKVKWVNNKWYTLFYDENVLAPLRVYVPRNFHRIKINEFIIFITFNKLTKINIYQDRIVFLL